LNWKERKENLKCALGAGGNEAYDKVVKNMRFVVNDYVRITHCRDYL
jgi:hypothetical protein